MRKLKNFYRKTKGGKPIPHSNIKAYDKPSQLRWQQFIPENGDCCDTDEVNILECCAGWQHFVKTDASGYVIPATLIKARHKPKGGYWHRLLLVEGCCATKPFDVLFTIDTTGSIPYTLDLSNAFDFDQEIGDITINWGDGNTETISVEDYLANGLTHEYTGEQVFSISITFTNPEDVVDIDLDGIGILSFGFSPKMTSVEHIHLSNNNLEEFLPTFIPSTIEHINIAGNNISEVSMIETLSIIDSLGISGVDIDLDLVSDPDVDGIFTDITPELSAILLSLQSKGWVINYGQILGFDITLGITVDITSTNEVGLDNLQTPGPPNTFRINWGDGTPLETTSGVGSGSTHTYATPGEYIINIEAENVVDVAFLGMTDKLGNSPDINLTRVNVISPGIVYTGNLVFRAQDSEFFISAGIPTSITSIVLDANGWNRAVAYSNLVNLSNLVPDHSLDAGPYTIKIQNPGGSDDTFPSITLAEQDIIDVLDALGWTVEYN